MLYVRECITDTRNNSRNKFLIEVGDNMKKILLSLILFVMIICLVLSTKVYAAGSIADDGDSFIQLGKEKYNENKPIDEGELQNTSEEIYNLLFTIAVVLAFGVGLVIGIQFITGSVDEKAKIKETLVPYIIGCIVIFSAFTIWKIVIEVGNSMEGQSGTSSNNTAMIMEDKNLKENNMFLTFS